MSESGELVSLQDKAEIEAFLRGRASLHLFELGDLDDQYWPDTRWFGWRTNGGLSQVALFYTGLGTPVLMRGLLAALQDEMPSRLYCHLRLAHG